MAATYKLRCTLAGHSKDVRTVTCLLSPEGAVVTGSRDKTARVWTPQGNAYIESLKLEGHAHFISVVCAVPPDDRYPQGLILTGSHDSIIRAYTPTSPEPVYKLAGHSSNVCALVAGKFGTVLSGSWDHSSRVWLGEKCLLTLQGHEGPVWAVTMLPEQGLMLSGSADKTIKLWKTGKCENTFRGHTDCVRGLTVLSASTFLSCSNDGSIRHWVVTGECLKTYFGHNNYIYSVAVIPNTQDFISAGEDRTVRIWKKGECWQTITLPAQSVWSVATLQNGDFVAGSSDGMARIFTCCPEKYAPEEERNVLEAEVSQNVLTQGELGGLKISELPGKEALYQSGKRDGQTKMIREGTLVCAYQWVEADQRWMKIGEVVGASGGTQSSSGKVLFEGKEYDYVFNVDIEDGTPELKLPYNISEDPWFAAQKFIEKNNLSQLFLDQVANFIIKNTEGLTLGSASSASDYVDPFTGASRYVPGSVGGNQSGLSIPHGGLTLGGAADPFTGSSRHVPASGGEDPSQIINSLFPQRSCQTIDISSVPAAIDKLKDLNQRSGDGRCKHEDAALESVAKLTDIGTQSVVAELAILNSLLQWPADMVFPALDILRLAIRNPKVNQHYCSEQNQQQFLALVLSHVSSSIQKNQLLGIRTLANMFTHEEGQKLALSSSDAILSAVVNALPSENKNTQIAACTVLLNYSVCYTILCELENKLKCVSNVAIILERIKDADAMYRLLMALGTLLVGDKDTIALAQSLELLPYVKNAREINVEKLGKCVTALESLMS